MSDFMRVFLGVLSVATVVGNVWEHTPQPVKDRIKAGFPRVWAMGQLTWHYGIIVWPVLKMGWMVLAGQKKLPPLPVALVLCLGLATCGPVQPVPSDGSVVSTPNTWVSTAEISVVVATVALPGAVATVQVLPIPAGDKTAIVTGLNAARVALPELSAALLAYQNSPTATNECRARALIKLVSDALLSAADGLASVGFATPADVLVALGGLASLVDELMPVCAPDAGAPTYVRDMTAQLSRRPPMLLHPFPASVHP